MPPKFSDAKIENAFWAVHKCYVYTCLSGRNTYIAPHHSAMNPRWQICVTPTAVRPSAAKKAFFQRSLQETAQLK